MKSDLIPVIKTSIRIDQDIEKVIEKLKPAKLTAISKKAVRSGGRIYRNAAKALSPRRSGALAMSLSTKVAKPRKIPAGAYAVTGPRRRFIKRFRKGKFKGLKIMPTKYCHLVRKGTKKHYTYKGAKRKGGGAPFPNPERPPNKHPGAKPDDFMAQAEQVTKGAVNQEIMRVFGYEIGKAHYKKKAKKR